jgi:hypothetical protein
MENAHASQLTYPVEDSLSRCEWQLRRDAHRSRLAPWTTDRIERAGIAKKHPVYDFLFTYYSFRPAHLLRWSPGADVLLCDIDPAELDWPQDCTSTKGGYHIPAQSLPAHRREYLAWALRYLTETSNRTPTFNCHGLHEWAMLYHEQQPRHTQVPLRLSPSKIAQVVESSELRCSHYDAYRFFTPAASPRNRTALSRITTLENDQPGCIHVTMDLYKFAHKIAPWCPSELIAETFLLAAEAREIDMRASPYDLREYGLTPLCIEEVSGRTEYISAQRKVSERAAPLRARLIAVYQYLKTQCAKSD